MPTRNVDFKSAADCRKKYAAGFTGVLAPSIEDTRWTSKNAESFSEVAYNRGKKIRYGSSADKLSRPWLSIVKFDPNYFDQYQKTGSCVDWASTTACDVNRAVRSHIAGSDKWTAKAVGPTYRYRGHRGQGMSCVTATRFITSAGGMLEQRDYPKLGVDFSDRNAGERWAMGGGTIPTEIIDQCQKHQVGKAADISTPQELADANANGYAAFGCSGLAWRSTRDKYGVSRLSRGSWSHALSCLGVDDRPETRDRHGQRLFAMANSWGSWNSGPQTNGLAVGMWWTPEEDVATWIRRGHVTVLSSVSTISPLDLPDYGIDGFLG